jgi:hypothetical protein
MAEKKVIELEIKSNLNVAEKQLKDLGNAIKIVDKEATNLDATFEEIYGDIKPLTAQMGELEDRLYELAKAGKQNTKEYQDLLREVGKYKRIQQETDKVVDAAAQTMSSKLSGSLNAAAGGFALVQGSMGLFGAESKDVEQSILKVQQAMAISQGVETIREGAKSFTALGNSVKSYAIVQKAITAGQWLWNAAMAANPIGLLVAGIAALIAGGVALTNYFKSNAIAAEKNAASIKANKTALESQSKAADSASKSLQTNSDYQLAMAKASGASTAAIRKLELKLIDEKIAFADSSREIAKNTYHKNLNALASLKASDADEEQIKSQEEITRKSLEEFGKQTKNLNDANAEKGNIIRRQNVEIRQEITNHNTKVRETNTAATTKAKEDAKAAAKQLAEEKKKSDEEIAKVYRDKQISEEYAIGDAIDAAKKANLDAGKTTAQLAIEAEDAAYKLKYDMAVKYGQDTIELEKQHNAIQATNAKALADEKAKDETDAQTKKDAVIAKSKENLNNIIAGLEASGLAKTKAGQVLSKALALTQIGIDTAVAMGKASTIANAEGVAAGIAFPGVPLAPTIARVVSYASTTASVIGNIARARQLLSSGSAGGGTAPSGGGGGGGTAPTAPSFNVVGASSTNQIAQTIANQQQQPIKAYVVANDVTTQQSLDRNIVSSASIG